ncbi:hypothetical protein P152DRAFT_488848 [Eremomyces bilateralis CBS 781.70]|uniref:Uncharacterized protein n=1 Tax=Eremomyces bilateralis CBS 781.70 TaxID=1392243 RepID=A0A6G1G155_9PEZI|nr:uncharacterized protein P152DRAFT_488848 [Eremomyces bilateralis CBS 781.70]KAF1811748.1 hypothetical protein P152DRAFT_488848 [Eremomyces bilateralis CBS 781.70]
MAPTSRIQTVQEAAEGSGERDVSPPSRGSSRNDSVLPGDDNRGSNGSPPNLGPQDTAIFTGTSGGDGMETSANPPNPDPQETSVPMGASGDNTGSGEASGRSQSPRPRVNDGNQVNHLSTDGDEHDQEYRDDIIQLRKANVSEALSLAQRNIETTLKIIAKYRSKLKQQNREIQRLKETIALSGNEKKEHQQAMNEKNEENTALATEIKELRDELHGVYEGFEHFNKRLATGRAKYDSVRQERA